MAEGLKLFVQIPTLNERNSLPAVIREVPPQIDGISEIFKLVVDDGSSDDSVAVAWEAGADHVLTRPRHEGLSPTFHEGLRYCLEHGADIIVNTDGDGQYPSSEIPRLAAPVIAGEADLVVAKRLVPKNYYNSLEKLISYTGSALIRHILDVEVDDPPSGFRVYTREFAQSLHMNTRFSHTMDTLVQSRNARVVNIPVKTNFVPRSSRLRQKTSEYIKMTAKDLFYAQTQDLHRKGTADRLDLFI